MKLIKQGDFYELYRNEDKTYRILDEDGETVKPIRFHAKIKEKEEALKEFASLESVGPATDRQIAYAKLLDEQLGNKRTSISSHTSRKSAIEIIQKLIKKNDKKKHEDMFKVGGENPYGATVVKINKKYILFKDKDGTYAIRHRPKEGWKSGIVEGNTKIDSKKSAIKTFRKLYEK